MNLPDVSYVVPLYNKAAYISDTLDCLINQKHKNIEIVVINDCSTDHVDELLRYFSKKDKRIKVYNLPKNMGRCYARNYGNSKARSPLVAVCDADDMSLVERTDRIIEYYKKYPKTDIFYTGFYICDNMGNIAKEINKLVPLTKARVKKHGATFICHSTMVYKKNIDIKYTEDGDWAKLGIDDWKFQMDAFTKGKKFGFINTPLVVYRATDENIVKTRNKIDVVKLKMEYLKAHKI